MQSLYANKSDLKLSELQIMANDWHIDVLAVTETWLDSNIPDALVSITGYEKPFRPPCRHFSCNRSHSTPECDEAFSTLLSTPLHATPNCQPLP